MRPRITISAEELERRYITEGQNLASIAAALNCSTTTVSNLLRRHGIPAREGRKQKRDIPYAALAQLYSIERLPIRAIADRFGVQTGTINNRRKEYGIARRPRGRANQQ